MMGLFDKLGQQGQAAQPQQIPQDIRREAGNLRSDPSAYLSKRGYKIPAGMTDPRQITTYLLRTGQIGANRLQQLFGMK